MLQSLIVPNHPYVFISFPADQAEKKRFVVRQLKSMGINTWDYEEYSKAGEARKNYLTALRHTNCIGVVALISITGLDRERVVAEINRAVDVVMERSDEGELIRVEEFVHVVSLEDYIGRDFKVLQKKLRDKAAGLPFDIIIHKLLEIDESLVPILRSRFDQFQYPSDPSGDHSMTSPLHSSGPSSPSTACRIAFKNASLEADEYEMIRAELIDKDRDKVNSSMGFSDLVSVIVSDRALFEYTIQKVEEYADNIADTNTAKRFRDLANALRAIVANLPHGLQSETVDKHADKTTNFTKCKLGKCKASDVMTRLTDGKEPAIVLLNDDDTLFGIISKQDLLNGLASFDPDEMIDANTPYVKKNPDTVNQDDLMKDAAEKVCRLGYKKILVLDKNKNAIGWLWKGDAERWLLAQHRAP